MQKIQSIERAFAILELLSEAGPKPVRLGDLARKAGLEVSTCARIVQTLVSLGYVTQVGRMAGYVAGPMLHVAADRCASRPDLVHRLRPALAELAEAVRETAVLAMMAGERRLSLLEIQGDRELVVRQGVRQYSNPCDSATGRLLLAYEPEDGWSARFRQLGLPGPGWPEMTGVRAFADELSEIRARGSYARPGVGGTVGTVAVVPAPDGLLLAVGVSVPEIRFVGEHRKRIQAELERAAAAMLAVLAAEPNPRTWPC